MNALCVSCGVRMIYSLPQREYYCPKCGLVEQDFNLMPAYDPDRNPGVMPWQANLPQTRPAEKWIGNRCVIMGMNNK